MSEWQEKYLILSWDTYRKEVFELAQKLDGKAFDLIVAIARGGLSLSQLLSDSLSLPIASFTIKSYKDLKQNSEPVITHGLGAKLEDKKVLLVDDVSDTGKTFIRGIQYLVEEGAQKENITTAALYFKPHSIYKPDYYVGETSKWIIHPYEVEETMATLIPQWKTEGVAQEEIAQRLTLLSFPQQIEKQIAKEFN